MFIDRGVDVRTVLCEHGISDGFGPHGPDVKSVVDGLHVDCADAAFRSVCPVLLEKDRFRELSGEPR